MAFKIRQTLRDATKKTSLGGHHVWLCEPQQGGGPSFDSEHNTKFFGGVPKHLRNASCVLQYYVHAHAGPKN